MLGICSEPGLSSKEVITGIVSRFNSLGTKVIRRFMGRLDPSAASGSIVRLARDLAKSPGPCLVVLERIPPSNEGCVLRQARALTRMWECGASVLFSLNPEAAQLLGQLPECLVLGSKDLLLSSVVDAMRDRRARLVDALTYGIVDLSAVVERLSDDDLFEGRLPHAYGDALCRLVSPALRRSLPDEELRVRLCMLLLGSGDLTELALVLGGPVSDVVDHIDATAPFFRIDPSRATFSTLLTDSCALVPSLLPRLEPTCAQFPDVVSACLRHLLERGSYGRALRFFSLPGAMGAHEHALRFGPALLDRGGSAVVAAALDELPANAVPSAKSGALERAVAALAGEKVDASVSGGAGRPIVDEGERDALMFVGARLLLQGNIPAADYDGDEWSGLGRRLLVHGEAARLLLRGRPSAAMRLLIANPCGARIDTASAALLCLDLEAARLLLCEGEGPGAARLSQAFGLLESDPFKGLAGYARAVRVLRALLGAEGDARGLEAALSRSERDGDVLVQAIALTVGCALDLRGGSYSRAGVRSALGVVVARRAGFEYLARVARLFGEVAHALQGDSSIEAPRTGPRDELEEIRLLALAVMKTDCDAYVVEDELGARIPSDSIWLLLALSDGMGSFSGLFERMMPTSWRYALNVARQGRTALGRGDARATGCAERPASTRRGESGSAFGEPPVRVTLLGEFSLTVHGIKILDGRVGHRHAQSMLTYLLLQRRSTALRKQIAAQIWPECDPVVGSNRVYQATSALRAAIAEVDQALDPFVLNRSTRSISIDATVMSCDVDEMQAFAREAVDGDDDEVVLQMARQVERLYAGDLYVPPSDCTGFVALRREELRTLYVDAMVAGADAALRLERKRTASRLAANALAVDDMREDAVIALAGALKADGRDVEADRQCRRYVRRLSQATGRTPSWRLLQVMGGDA